MSTTPSTSLIPQPALPSRWRGDGRLLALLAIVVLSLGMRSATSSFTPVFHIVAGELGLSPIVLGLVGALPPFAFALAGALTPRLSRRLGPEVTMIVAIGAIVVGQVARAASGDAVALVATTAVTMVGIGIGNVLLPSFAKRYFAGRVGLITAVYTMLFAIGGASPAFLAVPVSDAIGWRIALAMWSITALVAVIPWIALAFSARRSVGQTSVEGQSDLDAALDPIDRRPPDTVRLLHSPISWALVIVLWASAMIGYGSTAWLPLIVTSRAGLTEASAAALLGLVLVLGIPANLLVPLVAARPRQAASVVAAAALFGGAGWTGLLVAPASIPTLWTVLVGLGALTFPLVLVQVAVRAATPRIAVRLSAFVQAFAYVAAGSTVFLLGVLHDATGNWAAPLVVLIAIAVLPLFALPIIARPGRVDDPR